MSLRPRALRAAAAAFTGDPWTKQQAKQELGEHLHLNPAAVCITIEERLVGECRDAAEAVLHALHDLDVDVPFAVTEDPRYEWLGTLCRYHPQLGMHEVDCDATGDALLTAHALRTITATTTGAEQVPAAIHAHLGTAMGHHPHRLPVTNPAKRSGASQPRAFSHAPPTSSMPGFAA